MRGLAIAWLVLAAPASARADAIWCGTFEDGRRPTRKMAPAAPPAPPAVRVRVGRVLVDGARDAWAARRIEGALAGCPGAGAGGRGAAWDVELAVSPDGTVVDARVRGEPGGIPCLTERLRAIRFARASHLRIVSARVVAGP